jgi:hypothetical protein
LIRVRGMEKRIMAEGKRSYPVGTVLLLAGPPDGKVIDIPLTVVEEVDKDTLRVKGVNGDIFRVHKSRIKKVIKEVEDKPAENQVPEAQGPVAKKPKEQTSTKHVEKEKEEEIPMEAEATAVQEQPKIKESSKAKPSKAKSSKAKSSKGNLSRKEKEKVIPFNPKEWAKNGVLLAKTSPFDHATHKLTCYVAVDAKGGFYHTINSYKHGNVESLGKNGKGGNSYPLKGHQCTVKKKGKTSIHHGKRTAEEEIARFLKEGYKQIK